MKTLILAVALLSATATFGQNTANYNSGTTKTETATTVKHDNDENDGSGKIGLLGLLGLAGLYPLFKKKTTNDTTYANRA